MQIAFCCLKKQTEGQSLSKSKSNALPAWYTAWFVVNQNKYIY